MSDDTYFAQPAREPTEQGRFVRADELPGFEVAPGLMLRPFAGNGMMVSFARYAPGAEAPRHAHEEEQIFVALDGEFEVELGDEVRDLRAGEAALIPSWVSHRAKAGPAGGYQLDIFCPPRQGLLDRLAQKAGDV